jgi:UDP-N-acetylmuramoyl-L-alanyl-D-glutamate--2,6-diaminopimelate ligase
MKMATVGSGRMRRMKTPIQEHEAGAKFSGEPIRVSAPGSKSGGSSMKLSAVLAGIDAQVTPVGAQRNVTQVTCDSRRVQPGSIFFALSGANADGNTFVDNAITAGAVAVVSESARPVQVPDDLAWVQVPAPRKALALAAANFYDHPANALQLIGITGTNG